MGIHDLNYHGMSKLREGGCEKAGSYDGRRLHISSRLDEVTQNLSQRNLQGIFMETRSFRINDNETMNYKLWWTDTFVELIDEWIYIGTQHGPQQLQLSEPKLIFSNMYITVNILKYYCIYRLKDPNERFAFKRSK